MTPAAAHGVLATLLMTCLANAATADLAVTGSISAHTDPAARPNCRLTKSGSTLLHYGQRLRVGTKAGLGAQTLSVVFEVVPYTGAGKYNAGEKQFGETPVEVTQQTEGIVGVEEKWLANSGMLVVTSASSTAVSGTVDAELSPTKKKGGSIHLSGAWSCAVDK